MLQFCSCCETLATLSFFFFFYFFSFIFKHSLFGLWTKTVFSKYLYTAYLAVLCFPLGLLGAFVVIIKLKLDTGQTSCSQSALTKSKGCHSPSQIFQKMYEIHRNADNGLPTPYVYTYLASGRDSFSPLPLPSLRLPTPSCTPWSTSTTTSSCSAARRRPAAHRCRRLRGDYLCVLWVGGYLPFFFLWGGWYAREILQDRVQHLAGGWVKVALENAASNGGVCLQFAPWAVLGRTHGLTTPLLTWQNM